MDDREPIRDGDDSAPARPRSRLRTVGRALKNVVAWAIDRIGFLYGG